MCVAVRNFMSHVSLYYTLSGTNAHIYIFCGLRVHIDVTMAECVGCPWLYIVIVETLMTGISHNVECSNNRLRSNA
jgi:hypothetical protein